MKVRNLVAIPAVSCAQSASLREASAAMVQDDQGSLVVMNGNSLVGIITERDVLAAVAAGADMTAGHVEEWMTFDPDTAAPELEVEEAAEWMLAVGYRHLPVVDVDRVVGVISIKDVLWALTGSSS